MKRRRGTNNSHWEEILQDRNKNPMIFAPRCIPATKFLPTETPAGHVSGKKIVVIP
jgi:hypothetical protein